MEPRDFGWTQGAGARRCIQHLFQMALHLHQMLCLKLSNAVVVVKSSAGQKGVDADNLTLHVQCFVHVREATGFNEKTRQTLLADEDDDDDDEDDDN